jgi:hypothetical protein
MTQNEDTNETQTQDKPTKADLFNAYRNQAKELDAARAVIGELESAQERTMASVVEHYGSGPYLLDGKSGPRTYFRTRKNKDGSTTTYARTEAQEEAEEV